MLNRLVLALAVGLMALPALAWLPHGGGITPSPPATLLSVTESPSTGTIGNAGTVSISLGFNSAVVVSGGPPSLALNIGNNSNTAPYTSGSGSGTLVFTYTAAFPDRTSSLAVSAVNLNGGTIQTSGTNANLSLSGIAQTGPAVLTTSTNCLFGSDAGCVGASANNPGSFAIQGTDNFSTFGAGSYINTNALNYTGSGPYTTAACSLITGDDGFSYPTPFCAPQSGQTYVNAISSGAGVGKYPPAPSGYSNVNWPGFTYPVGDDTNTIPTSIASTVSGQVLNVSSAITISSFSTSTPAITATNDMIAGQVVVFQGGGTFPTQVTIGTPYYVIASGLSTSQFEISLTPGGSVYPSSGGFSSAGSGTMTANTSYNPLGHNPSDYPITITALPKPSVPWTSTSGTGSNYGITTDQSTCGGATAYCVKIGGTQIGTLAVGQSIYLTSGGVNLLGNPVITSIDGAHGASPQWFTIDTPQAFHGGSAQAQWGPLGCPINGAILTCTAGGPIYLAGWDMTAFSQVQYSSSYECVFENDYFKRNTGGSYNSTSTLVQTSAGCVGATGGPAGNGGTQFLHNVEEGNPYANSAQGVFTYGTLHSGTAIGYISGGQFIQTGGTGIVPSANQTIELGTDANPGVCVNDATSACPIITTCPSGSEGSYTCNLATAPARTTCTLGSPCTVNVYTNYFQLSGRISIPSSVGSGTPPIGTIEAGAGFFGNGGGASGGSLYGATTCVDSACLCISPGTGGAAGTCTVSGPTFYTQGASPNSNSSGVQVVSTEGAAAFMTFAAQTSPCANITIEWNAFLRTSPRVYTSGNCGATAFAYNAIEGMSIGNGVIHGELNFHSKGSSVSMHNNFYLIPYYNMTSLTAFFSPYENGLNGASIDYENNLLVTNEVEVSYAGESLPKAITGYPDLYGDFTSSSTLTAPSLTDQNNWIGTTGTGACAAIGQNGGTGKFEVTSITMGGISGSGSNATNGNISLETGGAITGSAYTISNGSGTAYTNSYACPGHG